MRKILLLLLITFLSSPLFAATFVVTSNADSGPGTLRQALLDAAANGSAEKDYINFNLPDLSEAGRTIEFPMELPPVSPDLVIDGLSQPGLPFGVSEAKIKLVNNFAGTNGAGQLAFLTVPIRVTYRFRGYILSVRRYMLTWFRQ